MRRDKHSVVLTYVLPVLLAPETQSSPQRFRAPHVMLCLYDIKKLLLRTLLCVQALPKVHEILLSPFYNLSFPLFFDFDIGQAPLVVSHLILTIFYAGSRELSYLEDKTTFGQRHPSSSFSLLCFSFPWGGLASSAPPPMSFMSAEVRTRSIDFRRRGHERHTVNE